MKKNMSLARWSALSLAVGAACSAHSQSELKEVVVTATRFETRADAVISDVTVISREDIEHGTGRTVTELIARVAGVQVSSNGGLGKTSSVFIRGTENRHVLLLVDGVRYGSSTLGTPNFDTIALDMVERIEVLKGPASALYGSDAVGGVIQIFTRKGSSGMRPYASATVGEGDRAEGAVGLSGGTADVSYAFGVQNLTEKGFSATNPRVAFSGSNADRDGYSQNSAHASASWKVTDGWKLDARTLQSRGINNYDNGSGAYDVHGEFSTSVYGLGLEGRLLPGWKTRISWGSSADKLDSFASATPTTFNTRQDQWIWQNDVTTPVGVVIAGLDSLKESVDSTTAYTVNSRTTDSVFVGLNGQAGAHTWQANARQDHNTQFGDATTGLLGYGFQLNPALRAHASYGTSFKMPSFNALYYPAFGNATTQPETGKNTEVGMAYAVGSQQLSLTYFANRIQGFITTQPVVTSIPFARIEGWTLAYEGDSGAWDYRTALDFLDARNEATGLMLRRRADIQLTANASYTVGEWTWGASLLAATGAYEDDANTKPLGGYGTVDMYTRYAVKKDWNLEARVINLGDKFYQTAMGYNQSGRAAYVTLRYQPK